MKIRNLSAIFLLFSIYLLLSFTTEQRDTNNNECIKVQLLFVDTLSIFNHVEFSNLNSFLLLREVSIDSTKSSCVHFVARIKNSILYQTQLVEGQFYNLYYKKDTISNQNISDRDFSSLKIFLKKNDSIYNITENNYTRFLNAISIKDSLIVMRMDRTICWYKLRESSIIYSVDSLKTIIK